VSWHLHFTAGLRIVSSEAHSHRFFGVLATSFVERAEAVFAEWDLLFVSDINSITIQLVTVKNAYI
jgi:hypothetical protein